MPRAVFAAACSKAKVERGVSGFEIEREYEQLAQAEASRKACAVRAPARATCVLD